MPADKRLYHVAHIRPNNQKVWTRAMSLEDAKAFAEDLVVTSKIRSHAKSHLEWITENGIDFGVEREEDADNSKLVSISVFEQDDPELDPKPPLPVDDKLYRLHAFVELVATTAPKEKKDWFSADEIALYEFGQQANTLLKELKG